MKSALWRFLRGVVECRRALLAATLVAVSGGAQAGLISTAGGIENFLWSHDTGSGVIITGTGSISASLSSGDLSLAVTLINTTAVPGGTNMALYSFGFGIDPNATSVTFSDSNDGGMADAVLNTGGNTNIPSLTGIDICSFGHNNCSGGNVNTGIQAGGGSDSFILLLAGTWGDGVTIEPIGFKFQGTVGSFEFNSTSSSSSSSSGTPVPEPSSLALLGASLIGLGLIRRNRTRRS